MRRKTIIILFLVFGIIQIYSIGSSKGIIRVSDDINPFMLKFKSNTITNDNIFYFDWYWRNNDATFLGYRFIDQNGNVLCSYGFDGVEHIFQDSPTYFLIDFYSITNDTHITTFCIYGEIAFDFDNDFNFYTMITWRPSLHSFKTYNLPIYVYFLVISAGIMGFSLYFYKYIYGCENIANRHKLKCRSQWQDILDIEEMSEEEKDYMEQKQNAQKYLFQGNKK